ncbi:hypothetical protein GGR50DRAFT_197921 [Xylaria sp. CBS 124048]|nr:hypothetical protein GGR50DRAFT_197921 [Xylaria sp. CBS 124048]
MQALNRGAEQSFIPLGLRRGRPDPAVSTKDPAWGQTEKERALCSTRAYPSPPMSGSPPRPPKHDQEVTERGHGGYHTLTHDAYRAGSTMSGDEYRPAPPYPPLPPPPAARRPFPLETPERPSYSYQRPMTYPPPPVHMMPPTQYSLPPVNGPAFGPGFGPVPYLMHINHPGPEHPAFTSPKSQRKTKGHVASACVPCKRAHLRCDAQRPCARCLSNGKEDTCIDVQHKKRGRPRLRDDRESRFDASSFGHPQDPTILRPPSLYGPAGGAPLVPFDEPLRRSQSYRVLKSQPRETVGPGFMERGLATDPNTFMAPPMQAPEPVAFLKIGDLEVVKASNSFIDAITASPQSTGYRYQPVVGRKLVDIITLPERDRVLALCQALQKEQLLREPNYLPPIFGRDEEERVIKSQSFSSESVSRYRLDRSEFFNFLTSDGQLRPHTMRVGLVKDDSIYFVVFLLTSAARAYPPPPSSSPRRRDVTYSYQPQPFAHPTSASASFDPGRPRFMDSHREHNFTPRQLETSVQHSVPSPGMSPNVLSYSASASVRSEHPGGPAHQIPRSELSLARPTQQADYQLPPIRSHHRPGPLTEATWQRDDRTSRVDIGGLIEQPEVPPRRHL